MRKTYLFIITTIFLLSIVLAEPSFIFKQNEKVDLKIFCITEQYELCSNSVMCQITVISPNGVELIKNGSMTYQNDYYNYTLLKNQTEELGNYPTYVSCLGSTNGFESFTFEITTTGERVSLSNIIIVIAFLIVGAFLFILGYSFSSEKWIMKTGFYISALLMGLLAINSAKIIASESLSLSTMSTAGLTLIISVILIMFLYAFIKWTIQTFKNVKEKEGVRWKY